MTTTVQLFDKRTGAPLESMREPVKLVDTLANAKPGFPMSDQQEPCTASNPSGAGPGVLQFSALSYNVLGTDVTVTVRRVNGSRGAVSVAYATADGSLSPPSFTSTSGTLNWADGETADKSFVISVAGGDGYFLVNLSNPQNARLGDIAQTRIFAIDLSHFSAVTYTGTGSAGNPRIITTGVDTRDGLAFVGRRNNVSNPSQILLSNGDGTTQRCPAWVSWDSNASPNTLLQNGTIQANDINDIGINWILYSMQKRAGFLDVVHYTGNAQNRTIPHNLGAVPGCVMLMSKTAQNPAGLAQHRALDDVNPGNYIVYLMFNSAKQVRSEFNNLYPTASVFNLGSSFFSNENGKEYAAFLFGHDPTVNGRIVCGHYIGNGLAAGPIVTLSWQPRFLMIKNVTTGAEQWIILDTTRSPGFTGNDLVLYPLGVLEQSINYLAMTADGFQVVGTANEINKNGDRFIYIAIR